MENEQEPPDEALAARAAAGELEAFNVLVERYQGAIYTFCLRLLGHREPAEDATQEAFLSAYRALGSFRAGNFRGWLFRIAANECRDEFRRRGRKDGASSLDQPSNDGQPMDVPDLGETAPELMERQQSMETVERLLHELTDEQRQAVLLIDLYDFQYDEVARLTSASVGTVKSRVHRGRARLRELVLSRPELFPDAMRLSGRTG